MSKLTPDQLKRIEENRARALAIRQQREAQQIESTRTQPHQTINLTSSSIIRPGRPNIPSPHAPNAHNAPTESFYGQTINSQPTTLSSFASSKAKTPSSSKLNPNPRAQEISPTLSHANPINGASHSVSRPQKGYGAIEVEIALISPERFEMNTSRFDQSLIDAAKQVPSRAYSKVYKFI